MPGGFRKRNRGPAKAAFGADSADVPVRAAAAGAMVRFVRSVDDVVPALGKARRERRRSPFKNEYVSHLSHTPSPPPSKGMAQGKGKGIAGWLPPQDFY